ncbi:VWA domain-containing protein [Mycobacterium sp. 141]|uniref:VWA domain-containing protein n=1 Tax=Mycobacterium sp. 141 TaxID=1120797 RepID=UPI00035F9F4A|nr:VWA domain-containing protein [Mycobacterium sp. 141]
MNRDQPAPGPESDVIARWNAGDRFGVLCTGDPLFAETVYRSLAPTADRAFGNAEAVGAEDLVGFDGDRVVALAWDAASVHPALMRRCTAVLHCGDVSGYPRKVVRSPADLVAATVRLLEAAGIRDHGIEVAATRLAVGLHSGGCSDPLWVVRTVVADPRRESTARTDPNSDAEETAEARPGTESEAGEDVGQESPMRAEPDLEASPPTDDDPDRDRDARGEDQAYDANQDLVQPTEPTDPGAQRADLDVDDSAERGEAEVSVSQMPLSADDASGEAESNRVPERGSNSDSEAQSQGLVVPQEDCEGQGLGGALGSGELRVQCALSASPPRGRRNTKSHLRGSRGAHSPSPEHGPVVRVVPPERAGGRIAVIPSLRRAAWRRAFSTEIDTEAPGLTREDLRGAIRRRRGGHHTVIVVDGSSSLGHAGMLLAGAAADQAVAAIAARRGVVSVIVAAGQRARVVVERSTSLARTRHALVAAHTGGGTPLAHALRLAIDALAEDELPRRRVLLLTDGRPTVGLCGIHLPVAAAVEELSQVLSELTRCIPDVTLLPVGPGSARDAALFVAAGVRVSG